MSRELLQRAFEALTEDLDPMQLGKTIVELSEALAQPVTHEPIGEKLATGSIRWANDEAMFSYTGPLYAAPQPPALVKLTGQECAALFDQWDRNHHANDIDLVRAVEAAIRANQR